MVFILVFINDFETKIYSLIAMQVIRVNYSYWIRSFNLMKDQIIEILNEIIYLVLIVLLTQYTDFDKWTKLATFVYIGIILSYTWVLLAFSIFAFIKAILRVDLVKKFLKNLLIKFKIWLRNDNQNDNHEIDDSSESRPHRAFSEISYSVEHNQDSIRVEYMYSLDSVEDINHRMHTSYQL